MVKIYKLCLDAECKAITVVSESVILNYFERFAWI